MRLLAVLCTVALVSNLAMAATMDVYFYDSDDLLKNLEWTRVVAGNDNDGDPNEGIEIIGLSVTVPERKLQELAPFEYSRIIQVFWMNKTTGNYSRYTIDISGQWIDLIPGTESVSDGYGEVHQTVNYESQLDSHFLITLEEHDAEDVTVEGSLDTDRNDFTDLDGGKTVQSIMSLDLEMSGLAMIGEIPGGINFEGALTSFPEPLADQEAEIDEVFIRGREDIKVGQSGNFSIGDSWLAQTYNWTVPKAVWVSGYETVQVNISSSFFDGWYLYDQEIWLSNNVSVPVMNHVMFNNTQESETEIYRTYMETTERLIPNGFVSDGADVPWDSCSATHYLGEHKLAEFDSWGPNYMPRAGDIEGTSFEIQQDDAVNFAIELSNDSKNQTFDDLEMWLEHYDPGARGGDRVLISEAVYTVNKSELDQLDTNGRAGTHQWNLTFIYSPTWEERMEAYEANEEAGEQTECWRYRITVGQEISKLAGQYIVNDPFIIWEKCYNTTGWGGGVDPDSLPSQMLTLSSSEEIMKSFSDLEQHLSLNPLTDNLRWGEGDEYSYTTSPPFGFASFGDDLISSLTGLKVPAVDNGWNYQQGSVLQTGETLNVVVDANTGRLVYFLTGTGTPLLTLL